MIRVRLGDIHLLAPVLGGLLAWLGAVTPARGNLINVDFNSTGGFGVSGTYSGAAVLGGAGDNWNAITGNFSDAAARTNLSLLTSNGAASGVTLSFSGQSGFFDTGSFGVFGAVGLRQRLMKTTAA